MTSPGASAAVDDRPGSNALTGEFEAILSELSATFIDIDVRAEETDECLEETLRVVGEFAGADSVTLGQPAIDGRFRRTHQWVRAGFSSIQTGGPPAPYPWSGKRIFVDAESLILATLEDLPPEAAPDRASFERLGVKSLAALPLATGGKVVGALSLATLARSRQWEPELVRRLRLLADMFAAVLARKQVHAELTSHLAFERLISEVSKGFISADPGEVDEHVVQALDRLATLLDLDRSVVAQRSREDRQLHVTHQWVRDGHPDWRLPPVVPEQMLPWLTRQLDGGHPVVITRPDELPDAAALEREFAERHGPRSTAILPLKIGAEIVGAVTFATIQHERTWPPDVVERLEIFADILGNAISRKHSDLDLRAALRENERLRGQLQSENAGLRAHVASALDVDEVVGRSPAIRAVLHKVDQVAAVNVPVLLLGETGTGKELIAQAIHARSARRSRPLIAVNCAALPSTLIESELFGHEKGAFTGATQARAGRFELAHNGTLFLDEVAELDLAMQAKLLRALQEGEIQRLGASRVLKVDARIIAATNRDLNAAVRDGRFRADLYYRLAVFPVEVPTLRDRPQDIPLLAWHFVQSRQRALGRLITHIPEPAMNALLAYGWPGNVRELQNVIDRALILSTGPVLHLEEALTGPRPRTAAAIGDVENLQEAERAHITHVLTCCHWIIEGRGQAADRLGLRPSTLRNRMKKLGIRRPTRGPVSSLADRERAGTGCGRCAAGPSGRSPEAGTTPRSGPGRGA